MGKNKTKNKTEREVTVIGKSADFDGTFEASSDLSDLIIEGKFSGEIKNGGTLEVEKSAVLNVSKITTNSLINYGSITGNADAKENLEMCLGSKFSGNVTTKALRIEDGVEFEGEVKMLDGEIDMSNFFALTSEEFRAALISPEKAIE